MYQQSVQQFADKVVLKLQHLIQLEGMVTFAVSGGKSPIPLFEYLSQVKTLPWHKVTITLVDERITTDSQFRNDHLVKQYLLQNYARSAKFIPLYDESKSPIENIDLLNQRPILPKVAILGMGLDGHTASIFPCCPEFKELLHTKSRFALSSPTLAPYQRITFTLSALLDIDNLFLFAQDVQKQELLKNAAQQSGLTYPIAEIMRLKKVQQ